jgi:flagellar basal body P-ring protein FlgI
VGILNEAGLETAQIIAILESIRNIGALNAKLILL